MATKNKEKPIEKSIEKPIEVKYTRDAILASDEFAGYQRDYVAAILTKPEYTLAEAHKAISAYFSVKKEK